MVKKNSHHDHRHPHPISRRAFLKLALATGLLAACTPTEQPVVELTDIPPADTPAPTDTPPPPTDTSTLTPTSAPPSTSTSTPPSTPTPIASSVPSTSELPTASATSTPAPTSPPPARHQVAIGRANNYDRQLIHQQVQTMFDDLGGLRGIVSPGDRVGIKINLTGGGVFGEMPIPPTESYMTHPEVVRALGELLRDAGVGELFILEGVYQWAGFPDYEDVAKGLGATLINLNTPDPYRDFATTPVGENWFIYPSFTFNRILEEVDVFVSVAKMKCHWCCGVTHSVKNLVGLVPIEFYRLTPEDPNRSALHGPDDTFKIRLPRVIMDLNRARPVHLALIDGVKTVEAGEGPWIETMALVEPGVLIAGKDPVATDAVATAAMAFDPTLEPPASPFLRADNHLNLARELGLGTNRLEEIEPIGTSIDEVRYEFEPCWNTG